MSEPPPPPEVTKPNPAPVRFHSGGLYLRPYGAAVYTDMDGKFKALSRTKVLIYWPHGFGDCVFLGYILPFLEPSNEYWIARHGDDVTSVMEGNQHIQPLYTGVQSQNCDFGSFFGNRHFGMDFGRADGSEQQLWLPQPLYEGFVRHGIQAVLFPRFPEVLGWIGFPHHTKGRHFLRTVAAPERSGEHSLLDAPLKTTLSFEVEACITRRVEARLKSRTGFPDRKLCLIARNGYTRVGKNWGHRWREDLPPGKRREGEECRDFMGLLLKKDPRWMFIIMEDRLFEGDDTVRSFEQNAFSYAELFGPAGHSLIPFGLVMKTLVNFASLAVGVPTGPFHLCMAKAELPTIGLWTQLFPSWYDEPKAAAIQILSRQLTEEKLMDRPGSICAKGSWELQTRRVDTRVILGEQVFAAAEKLLG